MPWLTVEQRQWCDFLWTMTEKEIKARYKFAFLGFLWIVLNPVLQMLVVGLIFQHFIDVETENFYLFLLAGLLPWNFFSYTLAKSTPLIVNERSLIQKAVFPRETIVLSVILANFIHLLIGFLLFLFVAAFIIHITISSLIAVTVAFIAIFFFTSGLSLLFSSWNVRFRDINFFVQALLPIWFYATPIVYQIEKLPSTAQSILLLNPMTIVIQLFQSLIDQPTELSILRIFYLLLVCAVTVITGLYVFNSESKTFDDRL